MMKLWNSFTVYSPAATGFGYLVYQDDVLPGTFYVVPSRPTIAVNERGALSFMFRRFKDSDSPTNINLTGGMCVFDVELRVPDDAKRDILTQIKARYTPLITAWTTAATDAASAASDAAANPGDSGKAATATQKQQAAADALARAGGIQDPAWIQLAPIPFTDGSVRLNIGPTSTAPFVQSVDSLGKPASDGRLTTSFSVMFSPEGATFFANALGLNANLAGGGGGAIQVEYTLTTWFRTSDTKVTMTFSASAAKSYYEEKGISGTWREDYTDTIRETVSLQQLGDVKIDFGDASYSDDDKAKLRKWGQDALADAIKNQIPLPADPSFSGSGVTKTVYDSKVAALTDIKETFSESFAIPIVLNPQGMLPNITTMKDASGRNYVASDYFQDLDLADPFFETLMVGFQCYADFWHVPIDMVSVNVWYKNSLDGPPDGNPFTFGTKGTDAQGNPTRDNSRKQFTSFVKTKRDAAGQPVVGSDGKPVRDESFVYAYTIYYSDAHGTRYDSPQLPGVSKEIPVGRGDDGLLVTSFLSNFIDPTRIKQVLVTLTAALTDGSVRNQLAVLDKDHPRVDVALPVGNAMVTPYTFAYTRAYTLADGVTVNLPAETTGDLQVLVSDPFRYRTVNVTLPVQSGATTIVQAFVTLRYQDGDPGYPARTLDRTLDGNNLSFAWSIAQLTPGPVGYHAYLVLSDGTTEEYPVQDPGATGTTFAPVKSSQVFVSRPGLFTINLDPYTYTMQWPDGLLAIEVHLEYGTQTYLTKITVPRGFKFDPDNPPPPVPFAVPLVANLTSYKWRAVYVFRTARGPASVPDPSATGLNASDPNDPTTIVFTLPAAPPAVAAGG